MTEHNLENNCCIRSFYLRITQFKNIHVICEIISRKLSHFTIQQTSMSRQVFFHCEFRSDCASAAKPLMCKNFELQYDDTRRIQAALDNIWPVGWIPKTGTSPVHGWIVAGDVLWT